MSRRRGKLKGGVGREPSKTMTFQAGELVLPNAKFGAGGELARGKEVDHMAGANLGGAKVEGEFTTVGKMFVAITPCVRQGNGGEATEAIEVGDVGRDASEKEEGGSIGAGRARQAVGKEGGGLKRKGMERRGEIGGAKQDTGGAKDDAPKALDVGVLLRRVCARKAKVDLAVGKELTEVTRDKGRALVGT